MAAGLLRRFVGNLEQLNVRLREFAEEKEGESVPFCPNDFRQGGALCAS